MQLHYVARYGTFFTAVEYGGGIDPYSWVPILWPAAQEPTTTDRTPYVILDRCSSFVGSVRTPRGPKNVAPAHASLVPTAVNDPDTCRKMGQHRC